VRSAVESVDRNVPMYEVKTQAEQIGELLRRERLMTSLLSGFAVLALVLAGLGVYGTLAFSVARRTPEIGVRMALGAQKSDVVRLVMRESVAPVLIGLTCGIFGAVASGSLVEKMLFGLEPQDPWALAAGIMILLGCALAASVVPALRAAGIAPMQALRHE
jgi:ABC-type antimicrobial peptide transport system permease subunit